MVWDGGLNEAGYGLSTIGGKRQLAHRMMWEKYRGEIEPGKVLHHTCGNKRCCAPEHLMMVTQKEHTALHTGTEPYRSGKSILLSDFEETLLSWGLQAHYQRPGDMACGSRNPGCLELRSIKARLKGCRWPVVYTAEAERSIARLIEAGFLEYRLGSEHWRLTQIGLKVAKRLWPEIRPRKENHSTRSRASTGTAGV